MRIAFVGVAALAVAASGCSFKPITKQDRIAASVAASKMKDGTRLTDQQVEMLDKDATYVCEKETRLGTHIPKLTCRTLRRVESDSNKTQQQLLMIQNGAD